MKRFIILAIGILPIVTLSGQNSKSMQDFIYPYPVHQITLSNGVELAYIDEGKGDFTLLFIHGLGSYLPAWKKNIAELSTQYRCIALDLPGYGKSDKGDHAYNMSFFANIIRAFIMHLQLEQVVLVGHSMGGQIAITAVLQQPNIAERLVLVAPAGFEIFREEEAQWLRNIYNPLMLKATSVEQIRRNFELNFVQFPEDAEFMYEDRLYMRETEEYDRYCHMIPKCVAGMLDEPVFQRLKELRLPVLVVYGEADALIPNRFLHPKLTTQAVAEAGAQSIPNSQLTLLPQAGHFVQWEQARLLNEVIKAFLTP